MEEARNLNHNYVGTEHILLGLLASKKGSRPRSDELGLRLEMFVKKCSICLVMAWKVPSPANEVAAKGRGC